MTDRSIHRFSLIGSALVVVGVMSLGMREGVSQGLVYVDAQDSFGANPNLSAGNPSLSLSDVLDQFGSPTDDNKWGFRNNLAAFNSIYTAGDFSVDGENTGEFESAPELKQTISGLAAGNYDVYIAYWTSTSQDWAVAGGLTSGEQIVYNWQGPNSFFPTATMGVRATSAAWTTPPDIMTEGSRIMVLGKLGTASAVGGEIEVFINDPDGQTSTGRRAWFDGVAFVPAGNEIFLTATIDRDSGEIFIENNTDVNFTVANYSVTSSFGSLNATQWDTISGNPAIDPDQWTITSPANPGSTPFATSLAEEEAEGGSGGVLLAGNGVGTLNLGENVWTSTPVEDVQISLTLADGTVVNPLISYSGTAAVPGDLNGDGSVTLADYNILMSNMHTEVGSIARADAYLRGDVTRNRAINYEDFEEFIAMYDDFHGGEGAFARAIAGVPEPNSMMLLLAGILGWFGFGRGSRLCPVVACHNGQRAVQESSRSMSIKKRFSIPGSFLAVIAIALPATAAPVTGWQIDPLVGSGAAPLTGANTSSPTLGDGSANSANSAALYATIPQVNLADGQQVTLTGSAALSGLAPTHGAFRWGLLYEGGTVDTTGWLGFLNENSNENNNGNLNSKDPAGTNFSTTTFASTTDGRGFTLDASRDRHFDTFIDDTYDFSMTIGRFGDEVYVDSSLRSANGFEQKSRYATESDPDRLTFSYNRVGFLSGGNLQADQIAFSNIDVSTSLIETLTLEVTTSGPGAGTTRIVNSLGQAVDINYYEISSETGALSLSGWDPLGSGWVQAGGSSGLILAESNFTGQELANGSELDLGQAFDPLGAQNLRFFYGLADGTFARGLIEYVAGAGLVGDYNEDGTVDAADYVVWRRNIGTPQAYNDWRANFGQSAGSGGGAGAAAAAPEPASLALVLLGALGCTMLRRRV